MKVFFHCSKCNELNSVFARKCSNCGKKFQPDPFKTCPVCKVDTVPQTKKCECGYVYTNLKTYSFDGNVISQKPQKIEKVISVIAANKSIDFYIKTKKHHYNFKGKWFRNKPTKETVEFIEALYGFDCTQTKSIHDFLRLRRKINPNRANRCVGHMGKLKSLWRE